MDPNAKVLFVSADGRARKMAIENGAVDFIQKPFSIAEFVRIVKEHL
jgi:DNA-binding response OmpR family regulator